MDNEPVMSISLKLLNICLRCIYHRWFVIAANRPTDMCMRTLRKVSESVVCLSKWSSLYNLLFCVYSINIQANDLITNKDLENNRLYFSINEYWNAYYWCILVLYLLRMQEKICEKRHDFGDNNIVNCSILRKLK